MATPTDIDYACPVQRSRPDDGPLTLRGLARASVFVVACIVIGIGFAMAVTP